MEFSEVKAADFRRKLDRWYRSHHRKLPWRDTKDPYKIWISEIMVVEVNVRRVMLRLLSIHRKAQPKNDRTFLPFLNCCLPQKKPGQFNQTLMELGALVCKPER